MDFHNGIKAMRVVYAFCLSGEGEALEIPLPPQVQYQNHIGKIHLALG